jgi:hypothetical protein
MSLTDWKNAARAVNRNLLTVAIAIYLAIFAAIVWAKPAIMFNEYGEIRPFGLGYSHKTVIPLWVFSILLGVLCYLAVRFFVRKYI